MTGASAALLDEAERALSEFPETGALILEQIVAGADTDARVAALSLLAIHEAAARTEGALRKARERLFQAELTGATSPLARGWLAHARGYVAFREANDPEALRWLNEAASLSAGHPRLRARVFDTLGMFLSRRGDLDGAHDYFSLSLGLKAGDADPRALALTYGNLGRLELIRERFDEAERWLRLDLDLVLGLGERPATVAHVRNQLALALAGQGRAAEAAAEIQASLDVAPEGSVARAYALKDAALLALREGLDDVALHGFERARSAASQFPEVQPWLRLIEALLSLREGSLTARDGAWMAFEEAFSGFSSRTMPQQACDAALLWAGALLDAGDAPAARSVLARAVLLAERHLFRQENPLARIESLLGRAGPEGEAAVLQGRVRRMLGGVSEHWLLEQRSNDYHARRLQGERVFVTVWTCDLRGFTSFCSRTDEPRRVVKMLNRFFARVGQALLEAGGCIDKYVGDSILAYFQGPSSAAQAAEASIEAVRRFRELNDERVHLGETPLEAGIGLATGWVVEGNVGFAGKLEHTIIGTAVNTACRLVARANGSQILLDEATRLHLGDLFEVRPVGDLDLKGLGVTAAHELLGRRLRLSASVPPPGEGSPKA